MSTEHAEYTSTVSAEYAEECPFCYSKEVWWVIKYADNSYKWCENCENQWEA